MDQIGIKYPWQVFVISKTEFITGPQYKFNSGQVLHDFECKPRLMNLDVSSLCALFCFLYFFKNNFPLTWFLTSPSIRYPYCPGFFHSPFHSSLHGPQGPQVKRLKFEINYYHYYCFLVLLLLLFFLFIIISSIIITIIIIIIVF